MNCNIEDHFSRSTFLKAGVGGLMGVLLGSSPLRAAQELVRKVQAKRCILLWMSGGPSQMDTWDLKPGTTNGGTFKSIRTRVPGIRISEHLPKLAAEMRDLAVIRSMTSREGNHDRASYLVHTGYSPQATVKHPSLGSMVSFEMGDPNFELPNFVSLNGGSRGPGFLGPEHRPLVIRNPGGPPENLSPRGIDRTRQHKRMLLLQEFEKSFEKAHNNAAVEAHRDVYEKAQRLMESRLATAFDISGAGRSAQAAYGLDNSFGRGCLVARRLVGVGVPFVEVQLGGWDTHRENFDAIQRLSSMLDPAFASLVRDLRADGLLDETLVIWMGEFGRTPRINANAGRDHFPRAWSAVVAGGGISGGQVIGETSDDGMEVKENPVHVPDLFASIAYAFGIDHTKELVTPEGRPITFVDKKAKIIPQLFG